MMVHVLCFASLTDCVGTQRLSLDLSETATVADALDELQLRFPDVAAMRKTLAVAVNQSYADAHSPLSAGDELALIPPVSGG